MLRTILMIWSLALVGSTAWAQANEAKLTIDVQDGQVAVSAADAGLSDPLLAAIRTQIEERVQRSPLREHGGVHVVLQGQPLAELTSRLRGLDPNDKRGLRAVLDEFMKTRFEGRERPLAEPVEVIIGREFHFGPATMPGSIVAIGASGRIEGPISDVIALGSHLELGPGAEITQRLVGVGSQLQLAQGARVTGQEVRVSVPGLGAWDQSSDSWEAQPQTRSVWARLASGVLGVLLCLGLGSLMARIAPTLSRDAQSRLQRAPWPALGTGFGLYFAIVPVLALLIITLIGIPLIPLYAIALGLMFWLAYVLGAAYLGALLVRSQPQWQQLLLGLTLLLALSFIPVLGGLVVFALVTLGVGAILLTLYERYRSRAKRPPSSTQPALPEAPRELPPQAPAPQSS